MILPLIPTAAVVLSAALSCAAQSPDSAQAQSDLAKPRPAPPAAAPETSAKKSSPSVPKAAQEKMKPKVWTNEEVSKIRANVSVVGTAPANSSSSPSSANPDKEPSAHKLRDKQLAAYRDQLRQLRIQLETTEKKFSELRNFKGDNSSSSGGIKMNQGYSMTPVADQIKQLEEKKKQLQDQIDSVESDARKNGFDPGDLR